MEKLSSREGIIKLADETVLVLKIDVVDVREFGFSPFGGVNIIVKPIGGVATKEVPAELKQQVSDKPLMPSTTPEEGWELIEIKEQTEAVCERIVDTSKGKFIVRIRAEVLMVARNSLYKTITGEPNYHATWIYKVSWTPKQEE